MTDEEYVRSVWEEANMGDDANGVLAGPYWVCVHDRKRWFYGRTEADAWAAAAEFTRNRIEQIRQVYEEIATTRVDLGFAKTEHTRRVYSSILVREEAALAELKRGMK